VTARRALQSNWAESFVCTSGGQQRCSLCLFAGSCHGPGSLSKQHRHAPSLSFIFSSPTRAFKEAVLFLAFPGSLLLFLARVLVLGKSPFFVGRSFIFLTDRLPFLLRAIRFSLSEVSSFPKPDSLRLNPMGIILSRRRNNASRLWARVLNTFTLGDERIGVILLSFQRRLHR